MRGKVIDHKDEVLAAGITPAYAGKSLAEFGKTSKAWDHPRLCGEKSTEDTSDATKEGSPPPMRGKDGCKGIEAAETGDHPRLCGEKGFRITLICKISGSPPPMRGKGFWQKAVEER